MNQELKGIQFDGSDVYLDLVAITESRESMDYLQNDGLELYPQGLLQLRSHMMAFDYTVTVLSSDEKPASDHLERLELCEPGIPEDIVTLFQARKQGTGTLVILLSPIGCGNMVIRTLRIPFRILYKT